MYAEKIVYNIYVDTVKNTVFTCNSEKIDDNNNWLESLVELLVFSNAIKRECVNWI